MTELMERFNRSKIPVLLRLKEIGYYSSYNHNKKGITLATIPEFNEHGLWECNGYRFSRFKNVMETIKYVVDNSEAGLFPHDLEEILGVRVHTHLCNCMDKDMLFRVDDFGYPLYLSYDEEPREEQLTKRMEISPVKTPFDKPLLSDKNSIKVLLAVIKNHETDPVKLKKILKKEGVLLELSSIEWVLKSYEIKKNVFP